MQRLANKASKYKKVQNFFKPFNANGSVVQLYRYIAVDIREKTMLERILTLISRVCSSAAISIASTGNDVLLTLFKSSL